MSQAPVSQREQDARRARQWGLAVLGKTEYSSRGPGGRYVLQDGVRVDRWERIRATGVRLLMVELDADLGRLAVAAAACRAGYDYCRATEAPNRGHEAYRVGAELADAAIGLGWQVGLRLDSGRAARDAVLAELSPHLAPAGAILRWRRRWALARDTRLRRRKDPTQY